MKLFKSGGACFCVKVLKSCKQLPAVRQLANRCKTAISSCKERQEHLSKSFFDGWDQLLAGILPFRCLAWTWHSTSAVSLLFCWFHIVSISIWRDVETGDNIHNYLISDLVRYYYLIPSDDVQVQFSHQQLIKLPATTHHDNCLELCGLRMTSESLLFFQTHP